jgi:hypothetical protein
MIKRRTGAVMRAFRVAAVLAAAATCSVACSTEPQTPVDSSPADRTPAAVASTASRAAPADAQTAPAAAQKTSKSPNRVVETSRATRIKVPNGVGLDYQSAQDLWRSAGLHVAPAVDGTGAHRLPLIDANWVVLAQDLKAGSKVPADSLITATVKKYSDD